MEIRSSRRLRTLVTQMALRGLSANEIAGALIPMMARARRSNQRPDTLMQDRYRQLDEILLLRTAGPYIWVISDRAIRASLPPDVRYAPNSDQNDAARRMTRSAN